MTANLLNSEIDYQVTPSRFGTWKRYLYTSGNLYQEFTSNRRIGNWPLVHIATGRSPETGKIATARGIIAIGRKAVGVLAIGQAAFGALAIGQAASGLVAIGQLAIGFLFGFGQFATGVLAIGQFAIGAISIGQFSIGAWSYGQFSHGRNLSELWSQ